MWESILAVIGLALFAGLVWYGPVWTTRRTTELVVKDICFSIQRIGTRTVSVTFYYDGADHLYEKDFETQDLRDWWIDNFDGATVRVIFRQLWIDQVSL